MSPKDERWTDREDAWLTAWYPEMGADLCAVALARPVSGVYGRAHRLGIKYAEPPGAHLSELMSTWTPAQDAILAAHYLTEGGQWCAEQLGCSPGAVRMRMVALRKAKALPPSTVRRAEPHHPHLKSWQEAMGYSQQEAAEALDVSRATYKRYLVGTVPLVVSLACAALQAGLQPIGAKATGSRVKKPL